MTFSKFFSKVRLIITASVIMLVSPLSQTTEASANVKDEIAHTAENVEVFTINTGKKVPLEMKPTEVDFIFMEVRDDGSPSAYFMGLDMGEGRVEWIEMNESGMPYSIKSNPNTGYIAWYHLYILFAVIVMALLMRIRKITFDKINTAIEPQRRSIKDISIQLYGYIDATI